MCLEIPFKSVWTLQVIENAAAGLLTGVRSPITSLLLLGSLGTLLVSFGPLGEGQVKILLIDK